MAEYAEKLYGSFIQAFQHDDFSDEDIEEFHDVIDIWYFQYIELLGLEGTFHLLCLLFFTEALIFTFIYAI